jgi:hypothetical protein
MKRSEVSVIEFGQQKYHHNHQRQDWQKLEVAAGYLFGTGIAQQPVWIYPCFFVRHPASPKKCNAKKCCEIQRQKYSQKFPHDTLLFVNQHKGSLSTYRKVKPYRALALQECSNAETIANTILAPSRLLMSPRLSFMTKCDRALSTKGYICFGYRSHFQLSMRHCFAKPGARNGQSETHHVALRAREFNLLTS